MINLAVINNRMSLENSIILKSGLKKLFKINDMFDKFDKDDGIIEKIYKQINIWVK